MPAVLFTLNREYSSQTLPITIGIELNEDGRLPAARVRKIVKCLDEMNHVKVGQIIGTLRDGSSVADICCGVIFADKDGLNYFIKDIVRTEIKELEDGDNFLLAGSEHIHIVASDGTSPWF